MRRWTVMAVYGAGWVLLTAGIIAPLIGIAAGLLEGGETAGRYVYGLPGPVALTVRSVTLSTVATVGALLLGLAPAAVLGSTRGRTLAVVTGLTLAPLLIPPQVYTYAWQIALSPQSFIGQFAPTPGGPWLGGAVKAGLISAGWLWPVVALIVGAGWRTAGQGVYAMALLDTTPVRAFFRAVLPSLRPYLLAAGAAVFALTLMEFAIPHLALVEVYPTALQLLIDAGAPARQLLALAGFELAIVLAMAGLAAWSIRGVSGWQAIEGEDGGGWTLRRAGRGLWASSAAAWLVSVAAPAAVMVAWLKDPGRWQENYQLYGREWLVSLGIALAAGALAVVVAVSTVLLRSAGENRRQRFWPTLGMGLVLATALIPPAALGKGFVLFYNRSIGFGEQYELGDLYDKTPVIWMLGLAARYAVVCVVIAWLGVGRRGNMLAEQARVDGADRFGVLAWVLAPAAMPSLVAAGLIVTALALFEVVISQMLYPARYKPIALSILNLMHYGQDDLVITSSLMVMVAGILLTQCCGWLLAWKRG